MADEQQLAILRQGSDAWNAWREQNPDVQVDLSAAVLPGQDLSGANLSAANLSNAELAEADLSGANLSKANLYRASLYKANLYEANLHEANLHEAYVSEAYLANADLSGADLPEADLSGATLTGATFTGANFARADLSSANLSGANFPGANLFNANLRRADLTGANLTGADLGQTMLVGTDFTNAVLPGCHVYGISAWDLKLDGTDQKDLIITPRGEPEITVDNLEIAQFVYLLLNNERGRHVIDTITSKVVLILGRFTPERKVVLNALREKLRQRDYTPVLFDFGKPRSRSTLQTVSTLAHMARFVIADLTDARSVLQELQAVVSANPSVPVQPLILATQEEPGMFDSLLQYPWVLEAYRYPDSAGLLAALRDSVVTPAELMLSKPDFPRRPAR
jgi:uncharacterized protein YjbI with pentapeptide repeats